MQLGAGHDFRTGVFIDDSGNDRYRASALGLGAGNCNGIGLFVDNRGDDHYRSLTILTSGAANTTERCKDKRRTAETIGIMIDAGGRDTSVYPKSKRCPKPSDGGTWGCRFNGLESEHAAGIDREGDTGVHVQSR